jgi:hypothetical protein
LLANFGYPAANFLGTNKAMWVQRSGIHGMSGGVAVVL